ncbi:unnamed protein product [Mytilus coruscus]|uniref:Uncharacterized protein n=1 Tax=Mytilus coruscus TaxID=42192 RepID=A0A6J8ABW4_MYTCO|nr:unnamed protein product [Mytilus coruscus]
MPFEQPQNLPHYIHKRDLNIKDDRTNVNGMTVNDNDEVLIVDGTRTGGILVYDKNDNYKEVLSCIRSDGAEVYTYSAPDDNTLWNLAVDNNGYVYILIKNPNGDITIGFIILTERTIGIRILTERERLESESYRRENDWNQNLNGQRTIGIRILTER